MSNYQVVIIGGGAGGMSAALSCVKDGVSSVLLIEKEERLGGILNQCIHLGFGLHYFKEEMSGPSYASRLSEQVLAEPKITVKLNSFVTNISENKELEFTSLDGICKVQAAAIILATGSYERHASMINLPGKRLNGIYNAGVAQKYINQYQSLVGKRVFILGSGDIGLIMARRMTLEGAKVVGVAELMPFSNGLTRNIVTCLDDFDIPLYLAHTVSKVEGDRNLEQVTISQVSENGNLIAGSEKDFKVDCLLLAVGLIPVTELMQQLQLEIDARTKSVVIDSTYQTSIDGIFVCGNSLHVHDLVDYVSKEANIVGQYVAKYVNQQLSSDKQMVKIENSANIAYIMPQQLNIVNCPGSIELFFRVRKPMRDCKVQVCVNQIVTRTVNKHILLPAEMESIKVNLSKINEPITSIKINVEEE